MSNKNLKNRAGEYIVTPKGEKILILDYITCKNCTIQFENGHIRSGVPLSDVRKGLVKNLTKRVGEYFTNNKGEVAKIVGYRSAIDCTIEFEDGTKLENVRYANLIRGMVRNPNIPVYYGVGFQGTGDYNFVDNKKRGDVWIRMLQRCYDEKFHLIQQSYKYIIVCEEWRNFQNFAKWFDDNYIEGFALDKDILFKGNKIYSHDTCCFVPQEINTLFTLRQNKRGRCPLGVSLNGKRFQACIIKYGKSKYLGTYNTPEEAFYRYKEAKELYIKEVADKWKDKIPEKLYNALYNYVVEITD